VVYCGDTTYTPRAVALARNADLLIHEATHHSAQHDLAIRAAHSTAAMAARVAQKAGVKTLLLTHFSPRYEPHTAPVGSLGLEDLLSEARAIFPNTHLAHDFLAYHVPRHDSEK
jgi:ribonuclease Z